MHATLPEVRSGWPAALGRLALSLALLFALTFGAWREMAHQWWDIDTYSHILLIPPIIAWLVWLKREGLVQTPPRGWWPGLIVIAAGMALWLLGERLAINTFSGAGAVGALIGAILALLGLRAGLLLAFPLAYAGFLVPFGDEIIPPLQTITAHIAAGLTRLSGIETVAQGLHIDTPAGLFVVAEECSGVKFLIAMIALGVLVAYARFATWKRRALFLLACLVVPILANGVRAWATIFIAQRVGAETATGFDHIVYGWIFFAIVIALVIGFAWRWFEREPEEAGLSAQQAADHPLVRRWEGREPGANAILAAVLFTAFLFAALAQLG